jgi:hypothetical protein
MNNDTLEKMLFQIAITTTTANYDTTGEEPDNNVEPTPLPPWSEQFKLEHQFQNLFTTSTENPHD